MTGLFGAISVSLIDPNGITRDLVRSPSTLPSISALFTKRVMRIFSLMSNEQLKLLALRPEAAGSLRSPAASIMVRHSLTAVR